MSLSVMMYWTDCLLVAMGYLFPPQRLYIHQVDTDDQLSGVSYINSSSANQSNSK